MTHSHAYFSAHRWTIRNHQHDITTTDSWITNAVLRHEEALRLHTSTPMRLTYEVNGHDLTENIDTVTSKQKTADQLIAAAHSALRESRRARDELITKLAFNSIVPSDIATLLEISQSSVEELIGSEAEDRLARSLRQRTVTWDPQKAAPAPPCPNQSQDLEKLRTKVPSPVRSRSATF